MSNPVPYWQDDAVTLYHGDMRDVLPQLGLQAELVVAVSAHGPQPAEKKRTGRPT